MATLRAPNPALVVVTASPDGQDQIALRFETACRSMWSTWRRWRRWSVRTGAWWNWISRPKPEKSH